jgi:hypothetical protein
MNDIYKILIEVGFFGVMALAYYFWQRRRIISRDKAEIYQSLNEMIIDMEKELLKVNTENSSFRIFTENLKKFNEASNYSELARILKDAPKDVPEVFSDSFADYHTQIAFHVKS